MKKSAKKMLALLLAVILAVSVVSVSSFSTAAYGEAPPNPYRLPAYTPSYGVSTETVYFAMPGAWVNNITESQNNACGIYWWDSYDNPDNYPEANGHGWPGWKMTKVYEPGVDNLRYSYAPKGTPNMIFNNFIDGGMDESYPEYDAAQNTQDLYTEFFAQGDSDYYPREFWDYLYENYEEDFYDDYDYQISEFGQYSSNFFYDDDYGCGIAHYINNMVFVVDTANTDRARVSPVNGKLGLDGAFYFYYGNGEFGIWPTKELCIEMEGLPTDENGNVDTSKIDIDEEPETEPTTSDYWYNDYSYYSGSTEPATANYWYDDNVGYGYSDYSDYTEPATSNYWYDDYSNDSDSKLKIQSKTGFVLNKHTDAYDMKTKRDFVVYGNITGKYWEGATTVPDDVSYEQDVTSGKIYFKVDPSLWKNFKQVRLYMYAHDGSDFPLNTWGTKKGNMTDEGNNIWSFDFEEKGYSISSKKQYGMIFCTDTGIQTCDIIFDASVMGDTAYCTGEMVENSVDSNKKSYYVKWKNADSSKYAPPLTITSIGNIVGEALWAGDTKYSILVKFISSTGADGVDNAIKYNGKDMQQTLDDTAKAFGLTQEDIIRAIRESGRSDIKWDMNKSTAPGGNTTDSSSSGSSSSSSSSGKVYDANKIYFEPNSNLWKNYRTITFYLYEKSIYGDLEKIIWGSKKGIMNYDGNGLWSYDLKGHGITLEKGKKYGCIFTADWNLETADYVIDTSVLGKIAYCTGGLSNNRYVIGKSSYNIKWKNFVIPGAPSISVANGVNGLDVAWGKVANARSYIVYYRAGNNPWSSLSTAGTKVTIPNLYSGKLYYVQVQSVSSIGAEGKYSAVKSMTYLSRASIASVTYNGNNTVKINPVAGANRYQIARKKTGDKSYTYLTTTSTQLVEKNAVGGVAYTYQVRPMYQTANNGTAYGAWSATKSVATLVAPTVSLANKSNGIRATWNSIRGAKKYEVFYKKSTDKSWAKVTTTNLYYPILNTTRGATYYVQVRAVGSSVTGPYSTAKSIVFK